MFFSRGENKIQNPYTMGDMYNDYIKNVEPGSPYDISYLDYVDIVISYNKSIINRLYDGFKVSLPYNLGQLQIVKKKMYFKSQLNKRKGIDWAATNKYGKVIHHLNEHTDGYKYLYYWDRKISRVSNCKSYRFVPTRTLKRTLAKLIKTDNKDYFEAH